MRYFVKILPLAATLAAFAAPAFAKTIDLTGAFTTENMAKTTPTGTVTAKLDTATDELTYSITYGGLSGPVEAAHFHGPAAAWHDRQRQSDARHRERSGGRHDLCEFAYRGGADGRGAGANNGRKIDNLPILEGLT